MGLRGEQRPQSGNGEHFVDVCDPEANVPRPAHVVRLLERDLLPARGTVKSEQFQKQIRGPAKGNLQETNAHVDGFRVLQKTGRSREPLILEVPKGLLDTGIKERVIEACRLLEIGNDDIDVS
jgi:hypothetical protein